MLADEPIFKMAKEVPDEMWALVEIFGHRRHYGRVTEVEKFGTKMLRVDVPISDAAPLLGEQEEFETFIYGGASIFGMTPMTEDACRKWASRDRPKPHKPLATLPPRDHANYDYDYEEQFE